MIADTENKNKHKNKQTPKPKGLSFSCSEKELLKRTKCAELSKDEFEIFLRYALKAGLDPLVGQIIPTVRYSGKEKKNIMSSPQTTIDSFRLVAARTGKYKGQLGPYWCGEDGEWHDVWVHDEPPKASKVGILMSNLDEPVWGVARYSSYVQKNKDGKVGPIWAKMSDVMTAKCAEALGFRKACPQELSGIYTGDEMDQAEKPKAPQNQQSNPRPQRQKVDRNKVSVGQAEKKLLLETAKKNGWSIGQADLVCFGLWKSDSSEKIVLARFDHLLKIISGNKFSDYLTKLNVFREEKGQSKLDYEEIPTSADGNSVREPTEKELQSKRPDSPKEGKEEVPLPV